MLNFQQPLKQSVHLGGCAVGGRARIHTTNHNFAFLCGGKGLCASLTSVCHAQIVALEGQRYSY